MRACVRACVRVCVSVCLSAHAILAVRAIRSITKDAIVLIKRQICDNIKMAFSFNCTDNGPVEDSVRFVGTDP